MSAYKTITCSFKNKNILIEALKSLDYQPEVHEEKHNLTGYQSDTREEQAEIIVPKSQISHSSNDLGFTYDHGLGEYIMVCSEYDLKKGIGDRVKQSYAVTAIKSALKKNRFNVAQEVKNKNIVISANKII